MTVTEVRNAVFSGFKTYWDAHPSLSAVPIAWPNVEFNPVDLANPENGFIRMTMTNNSGTIAALGKFYFSRTGLFSVQCFNPRGDGTSKAYEIAEEVVEYFETNNVPGVLFRDPGISEVGELDGWYQVNVVVEFEYRVTR